MKVIKSDSGIYVYQKLFKYVHAKNAPMVVWQIDSKGERKISHSRLNSFHLESGHLNFLLPNGDSLEQELPLYVYSEDGQFIFKTSLQDIKNNIFITDVPNEIKFLEDSEVTVIKGNTGRDISDVWRSKRLNVDEEKTPDQMVVKSMSERSARDKEFLDSEFNSVSLDEEDKLFADKRESPRARPKTDKFVKVQAEASDEVQVLKLFDLSRGGIGFISLEPQLFPKGSKIMVRGFDAFDLDDPLIAKVMSHRPVDDTQIEFKIGCKFDEGQD